MSNNDLSVRDKIRGNDVTMMRSYLEVDVAEWFSRNEVPFAYEAFVIPSVVGPGKGRWDEVIKALKAVGRGDREEVELPDGSVMDAFDILSLWNEIYDKHRLQDEHVSVPPRDSLAGFRKQMVLPDFAIYNDAEDKIAGEDFNWSDFDYIVEVSGLYGVGLPDESDESDWWQLYRVSAVAFKEMVYRLLGLWDRVRWVIPNQPYIEGISDGIPSPLRDDDHFIIMNTTQSGLELTRLAEEIGVTADPANAGLSPMITPTQYKRPTTTTGSYERGQVTPVEYEYSGINMGNVDRNPNAVVVDDGFLMYHGDLGEVYFDNRGPHVREAQWRGSNMIMLREYVLTVLSELDSDGIVEGLVQVE